jgi:hypothetical protein
VQSYPLEITYTSCQSCASKPNCPTHSPQPSYAHSHTTYSANPDYPSIPSYSDSSSGNIGGYGVLHSNSKYEAPKSCGCSKVSSHGGGYANPTQYQSLTPASYSGYTQTTTYAQSQAPSYNPPQASSYSQTPTYTKSAAPSYNPYPAPSYSPSSSPSYQPGPSYASSPAVSTQYGNQNYAKYAPASYSPPQKTPYHKRLQTKRLRT